MCEIAPDIVLARVDETLPFLPFEPDSELRQIEQVAVERIAREPVLES